MVWITKLPVKVKIYCWHLLHNRIPTRMNIFIRKIIYNNHDKVCVMYFQQEEDFEHLFMNCDESFVRCVFLGKF